MEEMEIPMKIKLMTLFLALAALALIWGCGERLDDDVVMVVDGIGNHRRDVTEPLPPDDDADGLSREAESWYRFEGSRIEALGKV